MHFYPGFYGCWCGAKSGGNAVQQAASSSRVESREMHHRSLASGGCRGDVEFIYFDIDLHNIARGRLLTFSSSLCLLATAKIS